MRVPFPQYELGQFAWVSHNQPAVKSVLPGTVEHVAPLVADLNHLLDAKREMPPCRVLADIARNQHRRDDTASLGYIQSTPQRIAEGRNAERTHSPRCAQHRQPTLNP